MNPAVQQSLQLRDIHMPVAPGFWPLAPGWWVLATLLTMLIAGVAFKARLRYRAQAHARDAIRKLAELESGLRDERTPERLAHVSVLMRQVALARFPRRRVASLSGREWLRFLDDSGGQGRFTEGPGNVLAGVPYQRSLPTDLDMDALMALVREWVHKNLGRRS